MAYAPPDKTKLYAVVEKPTVGDQKDAITKVFDQNLSWDDAQRLKDKIAANRVTKFAAVIPMPDTSHKSELKAVPAPMPAPAPVATPQASAPNIQPLNGLKVVDSFTVVDGQVKRAEHPPEQLDEVDDSPPEDEIDRLLQGHDEAFDVSDSE